MISQISILGCGWLGLPLGQQLASLGFQVKGSTTTDAKMEILRSGDIQPFKLAFHPEPEGDLEHFLETELLIVNIPPGTRTKSPDFHIRQMEFLVKALMKSPVKKIIYISSTSIYPDLNREVVEEDVMSTEAAENKTLFVCEEMFRKEKRWEATIVRCAGLTGYDRNLVRHFAGKKNLPNGNAPVNLIHRDDVLGILRLIIEKEYWNQTINATSPQHPLRKDFYPELAKKYNYPIPEYDAEDSSPYKIISGAKLQRELSYSFLYPDPYSFTYS